MSFNRIFAFCLGVSLLHCLSFGAVSIDPRILTLTRAYNDILAIVDKSCTKEHRNRVLRILDRIGIEPGPVTSELPVEKWSTVNEETVKAWQWVLSQFYVFVQNAPCSFAREVLVSLAVSQII